jgi:hypothetical protein
MTLQPFEELPGRHGLPTRGEVGENSADVDGGGYLRIGAVQSGGFLDRDSQDRRGMGRPATLKGIA